MPWLHVQNVCKYLPSWIFNIPLKHFRHCLYQSTLEFETSLEFTSHKRYMSEIFHKVEETILMWIIPRLGWKRRTKLRWNNSVLMPYLLLTPSLQYALCTMQRKSPKNLHLTKSLRRYLPHVLFSWYGTMDITLYRRGFNVSIASSKVLTGFAWVSISFLLTTQNLYQSVLDFWKWKYFSIFFFIFQEL